MSKNLLTLLLAVTTFALYYLLINPLYNGEGGIWQPAYSIKELQRMNKEYAETKAQGESIKNQADQLKAEYMKIPQDKKDKMKIMVPPSIDKVRLLSEISRMLNQEGYSSKDLVVTENSVPNYYGNSVNFRVSTTYEEFKQLIDVFDKSMRLFTLKSVEFTVPSKEGDLTNFNVTLNTFYLP